MAAAKFIINGKGYERLEDVPAEVRPFLEPASKGDVKVVRKYEINGKVYDRLENIPEPFRALLQDKNKNGVPDVAENFSQAKFIVTTALASVNIRAWLTRILLLALAVSIGFIFLK